VYPDPHYNSQARRAGRRTPRRTSKKLADLLRQAIGASAETGDSTEKVVEGLFSRLGSIRQGLLLGARAIYDGDPAARSVDEVIVAHPGFLAISVYRIAHELVPDAPLFARLLTEAAHGATGIDIHPRARIGPSFAIDPGTGIVIGETAVLGTRVRLPGRDAGGGARQQGDAERQAPPDDRRPCSHLRQRDDPRWRHRDRARQSDRRECLAHSERSAVFGGHTDHPGRAPHWRQQPF